MRKDEIDSQEKKRFISPVAMMVIPFFLLGAWLTLPVLEHLRFVNTESRLAKSWLAISKTLHQDTWEHGYSPLNAIRTMFPEIPTNEDAVIDGWGNSLNISLIETPDRFLITVTSPGKDHQFGTTDDRQRHGFLHKYEQQW